MTSRKKRKDPREATTKKIAADKYETFIVNKGLDTETHWYRLSDLVAIIESLSSFAWLLDPELKYLRLHVDTRMERLDKSRWALPMTPNNKPIRIDRLLKLAQG